MTGDITHAAGFAVELATVTLATFAPHLGERFLLSGVDGPVPLTLAAVDALPASTGAGRDEPFALVFRGPRHPVPQEIHRVEHPELGRFDLFLVPIGPDALGNRYEAVFS